MINVGLQVIFNQDFYHTGSTICVLMCVYVCFYSSSDVQSKETVGQKTESDSLNGSFMAISLRGNNAPKMWHAVTFDNYNNNNNNNGNIEAVRQQQLEYRKAQTNEPEPEYQPECECEPARELRGWGSCNSSG